MVNGWNEEGVDGKRKRKGMGSRTIRVLQPPKREKKKDEKEPNRRVIE
jgi:hypothetical protein